MNTKKYFFLALATLLIGLGVYFAPRYFAFNWSKSSIYSPVSERTASFIYFKDAETLYQKLSTLSYAETLDKSTIFNQIKENLMLSNQFMSALPATFDSKNTEQLLLLNNIGSNKLGFTYVVAFDKAFTHHSFIAALKEKGYSIQDYTFQGNTIYSIQAFNADQKLSFALYNNLCIASFNSPMVEEALSACLAKHGKTQQAEFLAFAEKETPGCDLKWFIDHQNFKHLENVFFTDKLRSDKKNTWAKWSQYALTFDESQIRIDGAYMYDENQVILSEASTFTIDKFLPSQTAFFEAYSSKNNLRFQSNEIYYDYFKNWLDEEIAFFVLESYDEDYLKRTGLVLKASNIDSAKVDLYLLNKEMAPAQEFEGSAIYEMNADVISNLFPHREIQFTKPYFAFIASYVVFADDINVIKSCIQNYKDKNTLANDKKLSIPITNANEWVYFNPQRVEPSLKSICNENVFPYGIGSLNLAFHYANKGITSKGSIQFEKETRNKTATIWEISLDTMAGFTPQVLLDSDPTKKVFLIQDLKNTIYIINQAGEIIAKKPFTEKIESQVFQIDLYKTNTQYMVFNTARHIYILKPNADILEGYPIKLPDFASNSIQVINYDQSKTYRFFIACKNQKVYGYEASGKPLSGWSPLGSFGNVTSPIQMASFNQNDYLYFHNQAGDFFAFNRKGEKRFETISTNAEYAQAFAVQNNQFVNLSQGKLYSIDAKGTLSSKLMGDSSFVYIANVKSDSIFAVASTSWFVLAKNKWNILAKKEFKEAIQGIEKVQIEGKNWYLIHTLSKAYIVNALGEVHPDFPISKSAKTSYTQFNENKSDVLIVTDKNTIKALELVLPN